MTILAQDNFDSDTVGQIAPGWVALRGTWTVSTRNPVSGSNSFGHLTTSSTSSEEVIYSALAARADMQIETKQKLIANGGSLPMLSHLLRMSADFTSGYAVLMNSSNTTTVDILFFKKSGTAYSQISSLNGVTFNRSAGDVLSLKTKIVGSTVTVFFALNGAAYGAAAATFTDTSITAAGYPGLYPTLNSPSLDIDDFVFDDAGTAVDTTPPTFVSAMVASASPTLLQVTMSEALAASIPPNSAWSAVGSTSGTRAPASGAISGAVAQLTFAAPFVAGETITISYTQPGANPRLQDTASTPNVSASFGPSAVTNNVTAANNALVNNTANVLFTPGNWEVQASAANAVNCGAEFSTIFTGTTCTLNFDLKSYSSPFPQVRYRIDRQPWVNISLTASMALTIPANTSDYANKGGHLLEFQVKNVFSTSTRWASPQISLTGIILDAGATISTLPDSRDCMLAFGDSITDGTLTVIGNSEIDRGDGGMSWGLEVGRLLGLRTGQIGFGSTGYNVGNVQGVPAFPSSCNFVYSGVARVFPSNLKVIVILHGTNDQADVTTNATSALNTLLAATTNSGCKIVVLRPLNSAIGNAGQGNAHASQLQAAIAACSTPGRCAYLSTEGFFTMANSSDGLHPYGNENIDHIAPQIANGVRAILAAAPTLNARTFTFQLATGTNQDGTLIYAANLTGAKISLFDEASPDLHTVARYKTAAGTFSSTGTCTFVAQSTLAVGATGSVVVWIGANRYTSTVVAA